MDYYEILGVTNNATDEQVKKAFFSRSKILQQKMKDPNPNKAEKAKKVFCYAQKAYTTLKSPQGRADYDALLHKRMLKKKEEQLQNIATEQKAIDEQLWNEAFTKNPNDEKLNQRSEWYATRRITLKRGLKFDHIAKIIKRSLECSLLFGLIVLIGTFDFRQAISIGLLSSFLHIFSYVGLIPIIGQVVYFCFVHIVLIPWLIKANWIVDNMTPVYLEWLFFGMSVIYSFTMNAVIIERKNANVEWRY